MDETSITDSGAGCKLGVKERQKSFGAGLTSPLSPTHSPMSGLCDYMVWKGLEHLCPLALVCATCGFVGLGKYLWKCFWRNKLFELWGDSQGWQHWEFLNWILSPSPLHEKCTLISVTVGQIPGVQSREHRKQKAGRMTPFQHWTLWDLTVPSWTSAYVVMPQMTGQAYICFHEG